MKKKSPSPENPSDAGRAAAILQAAFAIFTEEGYAAARMEDIALQAGITKGLIYFYYESKQQLFEAVLTDYIRRPVLDAILTVRPSESMACHLLLILNVLYCNLLEAQSSVKMILRVLLFDGDRFPQARRAYYENLVEPVSRIFHDCLAEGARRGEWKKDAVPDHVQLFVAPCILLPIWRISMNQYHPLDREAYVREHGRFFLRSLGMPEDAVDEAMARAARYQPDVVASVAPPAVPGAADAVSAEAGAQTKKTDMPCAPLTRVPFRRSRRKNGSPAARRRVCRKAVEIRLEK